MANELQPVVGGNSIFPMDLNQFQQLLSGSLDGGLLSLFAPIANPAAPTLAAGSTGNPNGTYYCVCVDVTGWVRGDGSYVVVGFAPSTEASVTVADKAINWTLPNPPAGVFARILYRTVAGGASGAEKFAVWVPNSTQAVVIDNIADADLGTGMPTSSSTPAALGNAIAADVPAYNTTGTSIAGIGGGSPNSVGYWLH